MTTTTKRHALTGTDWSELSRLIDARESALLAFTRGVTGTEPYEAAITALRTWMNEHTDWGAA